MTRRPQSVRNRPLNFLPKNEPESVSVMRNGGEPVARRKRIQLRLHLSRLRKANDAPGTCPMNDLSVHCPKYPVCKKPGFTRVYHA